MPGLPMRVCAVILHYGDPELTRRVHRQMLSADPVLRADIRVLDNGAPYPYPKSWLRLDENLYWAGALHHLVEHLARNEPGYTHLWFLNNDIVFATPGPLLGQACRRLAWIERKLGPVGVYSPSALRNPYHPQMVRDERSQVRLAACVDGIAPLFKLSALHDCGGIDLQGNAYGYGVDVWTSIRLHEAGWNVVVDHQLALRHTYHSTARTVSGFLERAARAERDYLEKRLGPDHSQRLKALKRDYRDYEAL